MLTDWQISPNTLTGEQKKACEVARVVLCCGRMSEVEQIALPFVNDLPPQEKSRWQRVWESFEEARRITEQKGMLVPIALAAKIAGVTRQRIDDLIERGQLERVFLNDHPFVTEDSFLKWAKSERKAGRPVKLADEADKKGNLRAAFDIAFRNK